MQQDKPQTTGSAHLNGISIMSHDIRFRNLPLTTGHDPWLENEDHTRGLEAKAKPRSVKHAKKSHTVVWNK